MSNVLVFCESSANGIKKSSLELLSAAKNSGRTVIACAFGEQAKTAAEEAANYGASKAFVCSDAKLNDYNSELFAAVMTEAIQQSSASVVLASSSMLARDLFPRVAAKMGAAVTSDCTDLELSEDKIVVKKPLYSGKCKAQVDLNADLKIVLMRANQLPVNDAGSGSAEVVELSAPEVDLKTIIKEVVKGASEKLDLTEANIIVSGGRGMRDAEGYKILEPLAETLNATLGATRAIVDDGWVPHNMQVGQTGKTVAPTLYIACGISGAIQHLAGMSGSKVIVAINKDPEAPIFKKATYGIVGDVFDVVPKLTEEFKAIL